MELIDLVQKIPDDVNLWIAEKGKDKAVFFNVAGMRTIGNVKGYKVVEMYPEYYGAIGCTGISIIVKKEE